MARPVGEAKSVVAIELKVDGVFEALPFGVCEEVAPFGVAVGDSLVRAKCLRLLGVLSQSQWG